VGPAESGATVPRGVGCRVKVVCIINVINVGDGWFFGTTIGCAVHGGYEKGIITFINSEIRIK
jgi:hypothetical protein